MAEAVGGTRKKRKRYQDYLTAVIDVDAKWVTDGFSRDRRICLYGVSLAISSEGGKISIDPVIPCAGPLAALVKKYKKAEQFKFNRKTSKWSLA